MTFAHRIPAVGQARAGAYHRTMATLSAKARAALPDRAFAYVDSKGRRRLPIHDESHVRNALARFNQVAYESEEARERAFQKLLKVAIGHGIAPVGFVAARMREAREASRPDLPSGQVTLMLTDLEGSTGLVRRLGDGYPPLLERLNDLMREQVAHHDGYEVDDRADEFFAVFPTAAGGVQAAVAIQRAVAAAIWPAAVRVRIGLHSGSPARTDTGYVGIAVNTAARVCFAGHGGQILVTEAVREELAAPPSPRIRLVAMGSHLFHGLAEQIAVYQVRASGLDAEFPPLRAGSPGS